MLGRRILDEWGVGLVFDGHEQVSEKVRGEEEVMLYYN